MECEGTRRSREREEDQGVTTRDFEDDDCCMQLHCGVSNLFHVPQATQTQTSLSLGRLPHASTETFPALLNLSAAACMDRNLIPTAQSGTRQDTMVVSRTSERWEGDMMRLSWMTSCQLVPLRCGYTREEVYRVAALLRINIVPKAVSAFTG